MSWEICPECGIGKGEDHKRGCTRSYAPRTPNYSTVKESAMQHDFILIDRSGSMSGQWAEAINSVNTYLKGLKDQKVDTGVTIAAFDGQGGLDYQLLRDRITAETIIPLGVGEVAPRGSTPLSDAIGRMVDSALAGNYDKVSIIIMTDGHENASRELSVAQAKEKLDQCRNKGWQVSFLGADFQNDAQATSYGNSARNTVFATTANLSATMDSFSAKRGLYSATGQSMNWTDEEKAKAAAPQSQQQPAK